MMQQNDEWDAAALNIKIITPSSPEKPPALGGIWPWHSRELHCNVSLQHSKWKTPSPVKISRQGGLNIIIYRGLCLDQVQEVPSVTIKQSLWDRNFSPSIGLSPSKCLGYIPWKCKGVWWVVANMWLLSSSCEIPTPEPATSNHAGRRCQ